MHSFGDIIFNVLLRENKDSVFTLYEKKARLKGPQLLSKELLSDNSVKLVFDKPIRRSSLKGYNFKFFSNDEMGLDAIEPDPGNENAIVLSLSKDVTKGDYISVSYFPGSLLATDGSKADAFGPEAIYNPENTVGISVINERTMKVYPNPATCILNIEYDKAPYHVSLYNSLEVLVYLGISNNELLQFEVGQFKKGLYLIRIKDAENSFTTKK